MFMFCNITFENIFLILLALPLLKLLFFTIWNIIKELIPINNILKKYQSKDKESWAVVTGGTGGIGLGFCEELTKMGFNVCIVSRNEKKIETTIQNLKKIRPKEF